MPPDTEWRHPTIRRPGPAREPMKVQLVTDECEDEPLFEDGGRPRKCADLLTLGLDMSKAIDPDRPRTAQEGGGYHLYH